VSQFRTAPKNRKSSLKNFTLSTRMLKIARKTSEKEPADARKGHVNQVIVMYR
jgi:hypothetical protein